VKKVTVATLIIFILIIASFFVFLYTVRNSEGVAFLNKVRYDTGQHKGAEFCKSCHQEIYNQWKNNSRHAVATTAESVREVIHNLKRHTLLNYMLGGEDMCYACHGPKAADEGINCETCHGPALPDAPIEESHEKVFKLNRPDLEKEDFCAKCHEIPGWVTPYGDWVETKLVEQGITCQKCHMDSPQSKHAYHGFDSLVIKQTIYKNDLSLNNIILNFPVLSLSIQNHIEAHGIPAGGPTRILSLEISFKDTKGGLLYKESETFAKYHRVMPILGFWPYEIVADKQLKAAEKRHLSFTLPSDLKDKIKSIQLILRFYEVADEHEGNIDKAYFISEPILKKEIQI
jgi:hypothetical protein